MFRSTLRISRLPTRLPVLVPTARTLATSRAHCGIVDAAKDVLSKANKKTGEVLAGGIDKAESATPSAEQIKETASNAAETVNKKTGEVLADGIDKAAKVTPGSAAEAKEAAANAADKLNKKTGEVLADGIDKAESATESAKNLAEETKEKAAAKGKVAKNASGYKDLQDKGAKVESEQNRPDDAV